MFILLVQIYKEKRAQVTLESLSNQVPAIHSAMSCDREVFCLHNFLLNELVIPTSFRFHGSSCLWTVLPLQVWKQESLRQQNLLWIQQCSVRPATSSKTLIDLSLLPLKLADLLKMLHKH